jgi:hypothetical protein
MMTGMSSEDECYDTDEQVIRALLAKHGYDPDLPARGVTGPPGQVIDGWGSRSLGRIVGCIYCSKDMP